MLYSESCNPELGRRRSCGLALNLVLSGDCGTRVWERLSRWRWWRRGEAVVAMAATMWWWRKEGFGSGPGGKFCEATAGEQHFNLLLKNRSGPPAGVAL
jgi:hypothetical protein